MSEPLIPATDLYPSSEEMEVSRLQTIIEDLKDRIAELEATVAEQEETIAVLSAGPTNSA